MNQLTPCSRVLLEKISFSACQEIPSILWKSEAHCRIHNSSPPAPILHQISPVNTPHYFLKIYFNIILPFTTRSSEWSLSLSIPHKIPVCIYALPIRSTCPAHLILLDLIARIVYGEEYGSLSSSLCSYLHSPVTSPFLGPHILLSTVFSNTVILFLLQYEKPSFTPIQNKRQNYSYVCLDLHTF